MLQSVILTHPIHRLNLQKIASKIYDIMGKMDAAFCPSAEPIPKEKRLMQLYNPLRLEQSWGAKSFDCAWMIFKGKKPEGEDIFAILDIGGEGMVYDKDGNDIMAITTTSNKINSFQVFKGKVIVPLSAQPSEFELHVDCGYNGAQQAGSYKPILRRADIVRKNPLYHEFYYSYMTLFAAMQVITDKSRSSEIASALRASIKNINSPKLAIEILNAEYKKENDQTLAYTAVGHGHLDLAWLWPIRESKRKAYRTMSAQLNNIENYEGYVYGLSQPQQIEWIKKDEPAIFEKLKKAILDGKIEPQGGFWTECDCNLVSGESFIRQAIYGKKFWREEIGVDVRTCWLPDAFGFSAAMPQIIKGCDMDYFFTIKMSWNSVNKFPYNSFNWVGQDGTKVLAHIAPESDYTCTASPIVNARGTERYTEKEIAPVALIAYGVGDGGCGPSEGHLEMINHQENIKGLPSIKFGSAVDLFKKLSVYENELPVYNGELYLETHQGTFTTQGKNKKYNRKLEIKLHNTEYLLAQMRIKGMDISAYKLDAIWKEVLLYQFHDILPGSSITRVYDESVPRYAAMDKELDNIISKISTELGKNKGYFNAGGVTKTDILDIGKKAYKAYARPYSEAVLTELAISDLSKNSNVMENEYLKVQFGGNGEIISCYDKENNRETVKGCFNELMVYSDPRNMYDAWNIKPNYEKLPKKTFGLANRTMSIECGAVICTNHYTYNNSTITQKVILKTNSRLIEFETEINWFEKHKMLRANFYPEDYSERAICDCQFGYKEYATTENDSIEKAKFEVSAHKFVDVSSAGYGFALINDCKYGHRIKNGKVSLNLLRSPVFPDPKADRGSHTFKYAAYIHKGDMLEACVQDIAYAYNNDFLPFGCKTDTIASVDNANIIIDTIKPSENGNGITIRLFEKTGSAQKTTITIPDGYNLYETNMLEENPIKVGFEQEFHKFEIKTFVLKK